MTKEINKDYYVICEVYNTRYSCGHVVKLYYHDILIHTIKIRYYNRTWERYTFESILVNLAYKLDKDFKEIPLKDRIAFYNDIKK